MIHSPSGHLRTYGYYVHRSPVYAFCHFHCNPSGAPCNDDVRALRNACSTLTTTVPRLDGDKQTENLPMVSVTSTHNREQLPFLKSLSKQRQRLGIRACRRRWLITAIHCSSAEWKHAWKTSLHLRETLTPMKLKHVSNASCLKSLIVKSQVENAKGRSNQDRIKLQISSETRLRIQ